MNSITTILSDDRQGTFFYHTFHALREKKIDVRYNLKFPKLRIRELSEQTVKDSIYEQGSVLILLSYTSLEDRIIRTKRLLDSIPIPGRIRIVIDYSNEGGSWKDIDHIEALFLKFLPKVKPSQITFLCQNRNLVTLAERPQVLYFDTFIILAWLKTLEVIDRLESSSLTNPFRSAGSRCALCLNATPRYHRAVLVQALTKVFDIVNPGSKTNRQHEVSSLVSFPGFNYNKGSETADGFIDFAMANRIDISEIDFEKFLSVLPLRLDTPSETGNALAGVIPLEYYKTSSCSIVCETGWGAESKRITEKAFKAIALGHPTFVLGHLGSIGMIKRLGYDVFDSFIDHSYESEAQLGLRVDKIITSARNFLLGPDTVDVSRRQISDISTHNVKWTAGGFIEHYHNAYLESIFESITSNCLHLPPARASASRITFASNEAISSKLQTYANQTIDIANCTSRVMFTYSHEEVQTIRECEETLYVARRFAEARLSNLQLLKIATGKGIKCISLGEGCLPRTLMTRWGLKPNKAMGELTHPFDLSVHPALAIPEILRNRFSDYLSLENLDVCPANKWILNTKYKVSFNHENSAEFIANDFEAFRERYIRRVDAFLRDIASSRSSLFFIHMNFADHKTFETCLNQLMEILPVVTRGRDFKVIALNPGTERIDCPEYCNMDSASSLSCLEHRGIIVNSTLPSSDYTFHNPRHLFSLAGYEFERLPATVIHQVLSEMINT